MMKRPAKRVERIFSATSNPNVRLGSGGVGLLGRVSVGHPAYRSSQPDQHIFVDSQAPVTWQNICSQVDVSNTRRSGLPRIPERCLRSS